MTTSEPTVGIRLDNLTKKFPGGTTALILYGLAALLENVARKRWGT